MNKLFKTSFVRLSFGAAFSLSTAIWPFAANGTMLTFDDITVPSGLSYVNVPNGYGGLQWKNSGVLNAYTEFGTGYYNGMVSPNHVAFDPYGFPASFSSTTSFHLNSLYMTSVYQSSMQVEVQGCFRSSLVYDHTYTVGGSDAFEFEL